MNTQTTAKRTNGLAIVSLIAGLIAPIYTFAFGIQEGTVVHTGGYFVVLLGIVATISGIVALAQIRKRSDTEKGKGLAIAGLILGILSVGIVLLQIFVIGPYIRNVIAPQIMGTPVP